MSQLAAIQALEKRLLERLQQYREKAGSGLDQETYQRYVGRIKELDAIIKDDLPQARRSAQKDE